MPFTVEIWCPDCTGEDYQGCFDGGTEFLAHDYHPYERRVFATREEAEAAGREATSHSIWRYDIHEVPAAAGTTPAPGAGEQEEGT